MTALKEQFAVSLQRREKLDKKKKKEFPLRTLRENESQVVMGVRAEKRGAA